MTSRRSIPNSCAAKPRASPRLEARRRADTQYLRVESFVDELAAAAKQDPVAYRRAMLQSNPRALAVLNLAVEKGNWGAPLPPGHGRGIQVQYAFETYLATVLEAEVTPRGEILPRRVVVAVDCGSVINPDAVEAQIQGGMILGLGTAMYNEITLATGRVEQSNFHDYRTLRMNEAPRMEVYQIRNNEKPGGIGETGTAAAASALGNAIFAATGRRLRRLPFANQMQESRGRQDSRGQWSLRCWPLAP
jgi:isoquinoline 1-oxidoreductase beta subunit